MDDSEKILLENIIDMIVYNDEKPFAFIKKSEKDVMQEVRKYTENIVMQDQYKNRCDIDIVSFVENYSGTLLDKICESNHLYLENGIKIGAKLILELLM